MNKRPDAENGNWRTRATSRLPDWYLEAEFGWRRPPKRSVRRFLPLVPITVFCTAIAIAVAVTVQDTKPHTPAVASPELQSFRWAVNRAMSAAELTQTANTKEDWQTVSAWWEDAIKFMKTVPASHQQYQLAQNKIVEYQRNLNYAKASTSAYATVTTPSTQLWSVGSRRVDVVRIQGQPTETVRYDALCQEVLHYGNSTVELNNGMVSKYEDVDRNLKTAENAKTTSPGGGDFWTLGSSRQQVFAIQGTPARVVSYDSLHKETLYYGGSMVELTDDQVTGYSNLDNNLRVAVMAVTLPAAQGGNTWTIGSERNDVFRVQGTPSQVTLDSSLCKETLHYGNSMIDMKNGFVNGYDNLDGNLRVSTP